MSSTTDAETITRDHDAPDDAPARPKPLALSDDQMDILRRAAEPLHPRDRGAYLETVADLLNGHEVGDGSVARAAAEAQRRHRNAPDLSRSNGYSKWR
jgi:hypothetical protein